MEVGKDEIMNLMLALIESTALKCVVELQIPDITHSHGSQSLPLNTCHETTRPPPLPGNPLWPHPLLEIVVRGWWTRI
ncbi:hypothetical protein V2J09_013525 [Rumex salicifolius]